MMEHAMAQRNRTVGLKPSKPGKSRAALTMVLLQ
jgi:hypothetical protein